MRLIEAGFLDDASIEELGAKLGIGRDSSYGFFFATPAQSRAKSRRSVGFNARNACAAQPRCRSRRSLLRPGSTAAPFQ